jgi:hypothetical protein
MQTLDRVSVVIHSPKDERHQSSFEKADPLIVEHLVGDLRVPIDCLVGPVDQAGFGCCLAH